MGEAERNDKARAILLYSGGLDSSLASELLLRAGLDVLCVQFESVFFPPRHARGYGPPCDTVGADVSEEMVRLVREPQYGLGKNANPCLDCKQMMYSKAWEIARTHGGDFIATGEVLGQRPMSQNVPAFRRMEKGAGVAGLVVRPLSGKLLAPTIPEQKGLVNRADMLDLQGRSRKPQMELAAKWGIEDYPTPAGGCKLTDPQFARRTLRLRDMGCLSVENVRAARSGRFFELGERAFVLVGRNHEDNVRLLASAPEDALVLQLDGRAGPVACLLGEPDAEQLDQARRLVVRYSRFRDLPPDQVRADSVPLARQRFQATAQQAGRSSESSGSRGQG